MTHHESAVDHPDAHDRAMLEERQAQTELRRFQDLGSLERPGQVWSDRNEGPEQ